MSPTNSPFNGLMLMSYGMLISIVVIVPLGFFDLSDNMWIQYLSAAILVLIMIQWVVTFAIHGLNMARVPMIGPDLSTLLGAVFFNFPYITTVPSWVNSKKPDVSIAKSLWTSVTPVTAVYLLVGILGGSAYELTSDTNILMAINSSTERSLLSLIASYVFPFATLVSNIPVCSIVTRFNLIQSGLCGPILANILSTALPWTLATLFMTEPKLAVIITWMSLIFVASTNFLFPFLYYIRSVDYRRKINKLATSVIVPGGAQISSEDARKTETITIDFPKSDKSVVSDSSIINHGEAAHGTASAEILPAAGEGTSSSKLVFALPEVSSEYKDGTETMKTSAALYTTLSRPLLRSRSSWFHSVQTKNDMTIRLYHDEEADDSHSIFHVTGEVKVTTTEKVTASLPPHLGHMPVLSNIETSASAPQTNTSVAGVWRNSLRPLSHLFEVRRWTTDAERLASQHLEAPSKAELLAEEKNHELGYTSRMVKSYNKQRAHAEYATRPQSLPVTKDALQESMHRAPLRGTAPTGVQSPHNSVRMSLRALSISHDDDKVSISTADPLQTIAEEDEAAKRLSRFDVPKSADLLGAHEDAPSSVVGMAVEPKVSREGGVRASPIVAPSIQSKVVTSMEDATPIHRAPQTIAGPVASPGNSAAKLASALKKRMQWRSSREVFAKTQKSLLGDIPVIKLNPMRGAYVMMFGTISLMLAMVVFQIVQ